MNGNIVLPYMPVLGMHVCKYSYTGEYLKILRTQLERKYIIVLKIPRKLAMDTLDSEIVVNDNGNGRR